MLPIMHQTLFFDFKFELTCVVVELKKCYKSSYCYHKLSYMGNFSAGKYQKKIFIVLSPQI